MANPPRYPDSGDDTGVGPGREYPGTPRWVKVSGIIVIVLVLLVVIVLVAGGGPGGHGPGRHTLGGNTPPIDGAPEFAVTANALAFDAGPSS